MGSKKVTIGYRYYMGIHMGLCRGPVNAVTKIMAADKTVWTEDEHANIWYPPPPGESSLLPYPTAPIELDYYRIDKSGLFGGDKREGGISGSLYMMPGQRDQIIPAAVRNRLGNPPEFRGVTTLYFDGQVSAMTPYIKPWEIWAWRTTAGWENDDPWYPARATIELSSDMGGTIHAMNPAHIIYQCHTDHDWGGGQDRSTINDAQMRATADALYAEGFGLCLDWIRQGPISEFIGSVCEHIGASWRQNRQTGLFELKLARGDYDPDALPVFDEDSGLLSIDEDESAAMAGAVNEVIVKWEEPLSGQARQNRERNLAAIASDSRLVSEVVEYPGIPTAALAGRIASRDLMMRCGGLKRFKVRLDRRGYKIQIGDVFRVRSEARGINNIVVRAGRVEDGTLDEGAITITCIQDLFALPSTAISNVPPVEWEPPDRAPRPVSIQRLVEATWRELATFVDPANLELLRNDPTAAYVGLLAKQPTSLSLNYGLQTRVGVAEWESHTDGTFADTGTLMLALPLVAVETVFSLQGIDEQTSINAGDVLLLDDEICRITEWDAMFSMGVIARGCIDTVPAAHAAGTRAWLLNDASYPASAWTAGSSVQARALTMTSEGTLDPAHATTATITLTGRQGRPYPPGNFKINGTAYPISITGSLTSDKRSLAASGMSSDGSAADYYATTDNGGAQWIWWRFPSSILVGRIRIHGLTAADGASVADMLNGCQIQYTTANPASGTPSWVSTGVSISDITDSGDNVDILFAGFTCRAIRLYKPSGRVGIAGATYDDDGIAFYAPASGVTLTWSHRDRIVQADQLIDTTMGNIGPEPGVTYRLRIYSDAVLRRTYSGMTGTSQTYYADDEIADGGPFTSLRFVLDACRDSLFSQQAHDWTVMRT